MVKKSPHSIIKSFFDPFIFYQISNHICTEIYLSWALNIIYKYIIQVLKKWLLFVLRLHVFVLGSLVYSLDSQQYIK